MRPALLTLLLLGGCPAPDAEAPEPVPAPARVQRWTPDGPAGHTGIVGVEVPRVVATELPGEGAWLVEPVILLRHDRPSRFLGLRSEGRAVLVALDGVRLVVDGAELRSTITTTGNPELPDHLFLPVGQPRHLVHRPRFRVEGAELPERMHLVVHDDDRGRAEVALVGGWVTDDGRPGVPVTVRDPAGRAVTAPGRATWADATVARREGDPAFVVPADAPAGEVQLDGHAPVAFVPAPGGVTVRTWALDEPLAVRDAAIAAALPQPVRPWAGDVLGLALTLDTPDDAAAWVRDHVGLLPTSSLRAGPSALVRRGAGGPQERAALVRELLRPRGLGSRFVCGDLPEADARALLEGAPAPAPLVGPVGQRVAEARPVVEPLAEALAAQLGAWTARPAAWRDRFVILPEWCWVEWEEVPDVSWPGLDLRPAGLDTAPLPFQWRSTERPGPDTWRLTTFVEGNAPSPEGYVSVRLAEHGGALPDLSEHALVLDVYEAEGGRSLAGHATTLRGEEVAGRLGATMSASQLNTVTLVLRITDPDGIGTRERTLDLWVDDGTPRPRGWRVVVSADTGARTVDDVAGRLARATPGRAPDPGGEVVVARHALYDVLFDQLAGGAAPAEPSLRVTILEDAGDDRVGWRFETWPPPVPARVAASPDDAERARLAAADAVARALVQGSAPPPPPTSWLTDAAELRRVAGVPGRVKLGVPRGLQEVDYGLTDTGTLWIHDRSAGAVGWHHAGPEAQPEVPADLAGTPTGDPDRAWRRWDLPVRCHEARRWAAWLGGAEPEACALTTPP